MLTAAQIRALQDKSEQLLDPITEFLIEDIAKRVKQAGQFTATASYDAWKLQELGMSQEEIKREIAKRLKISQAEAEELLTQTAETGYDFDMSSFPTDKRIPLEENTSLQQILDATIKQVGEDLSNITRTTGFVGPDGVCRELTDAYRNACDFAFQKVSTGAQDYNSAIRDATRNLANKGIRSIDYKSGRHYSIEAAVRQNIMGGLGLMQEKISESNHDLLGCDGWEISAHAASAPDHEPIQGKQYTDEAYKRLNGRLLRPIGTLNCGHAAFPIIMGVNEPQYTEEDLERMRRENEEGVTFEGRHYTMYQATQRQRKFERAIREQKRKILIDEALEDKDKLQTDQIRLVRLRQEYARFSEGVDLPMQHARAEAAGFDWKKGKAAEKAAKNARKVTKSATETIANSAKADTMGLYRRDSNPGAFAVLPERMSKKHIRKLAAECEIDLKGLNLNIEMNEDMLGLIYTGRADPEHIGGITFFPTAFKSKEELIRTLYHEKVHVQQFKEFGVEYVQEHRGEFEHLAYEAEEIFIATLKERGIL